MPNKNRKEFTKEQRNKLEKRTFGNKKSITDPAGRKTTRDNYEIDHIYPASKGGKTTLQNAQIVHKKTNREKSNDLSGKFGPPSNQKEFKVQGEKTNQK